MYAAVRNSCASCALHLLKYLAMVNEGGSGLSCCVLCYHNKCDVS